jgi:hypothetical protein
MMPAKENTPTTAEVFWKKLDGFDADPVPPGESVDVVTVPVCATVLNDTGPAALLVVATEAMVAIPEGVRGTREVGAVVVLAALVTVVAGVVAVVGVVCCCC